MKRNPKGPDLYGASSPDLYGASLFLSSSRPLWCKSARHFPEAHFLGFLAYDCFLVWLGCFSFPAISAQVKSVCICFASEPTSARHNLTMPRTLYSSDLTSKKPEKHKLYKPAQLRTLSCGCKKCKAQPNPELKHCIAYWIPQKEILTDEEIEETLVALIE